MIATTYKVDGMTCDGCVRAVTKALEGANATEVAVDLNAGTATAHGLDEATFRQIIEDAGFDFGGPA